MKRGIGTALGWALALTLAAADFAPEEYLTLSGALSPEVKMAVRREKDAYLFRIEAANPYARLNARLGAAAAKSLLVPLEKFPAEVKISDAQIGAGTLRLALEMNWLDDKGILRQREIFLAPSFGSQLPAEGGWPAFDYTAYRKSVEDRKLEIRVPVEQPMAGKLSIVLETMQGDRVRNLVSGADYAAGKHAVVWDGRDELGNLVSPGEYRFRAASHPGIVPQYKMQFNNGDEKIFTPFGSNHGTMSALATNSKYIFAAASITEGGNAIVALTPEGAFVRGYPQIGGAGIEEVFIACDEEKLYVVNDGGAWAGRGREPAITLTVYDIETGAIVNPAGQRKQYSLLYTGTVKKYLPGEKKVFSLTGVALAGGKLYIANREKNELMIVDPVKGEVTGAVPLPAPAFPVFDGKNFYAFSEGAVVAVDLATSKATRCFAPGFTPTGMSVFKDEFYLTGAPDSTIKVYNRAGKVRRAIGEPGGAYAGTWKPARLVNPVGVALSPKGELWTAEDRRNPKRLSRWNGLTGKFLGDKIGCPAYGSPGTGFDPENGTLWVGQGCLWEVDYKKGTARVKSVMQTNAGHVNGKVGEGFNYKFIHRDGRTFLVALGKAGVVSEIMKDGSVRDLALVSTVHQLFFAMNWKRGTVFNELAEKTFPRLKPENNYGDPQGRSVGVVWVDKNGNGDFDADEFEFLPANTGSPENGGWGMRVNDLDFHLTYRDPQGAFRLLTLEAKTFNKAGAPEYSFKTALEKSIPIKADLPPGVRLLGEALVNDARNRILVNSDPFMLCFRPDGSLAWMMRNMWTNVHGSQKAPLPKPGETQGILFALGCAPLDAEGDVVVWIGNHGRLFVMTSDGIYLDEMFSDCRVAEVVGPGLIGGEPFGGNFEYDKKNKNYLLTAGNSGFRVYVLSGIDKLRRSSGTFNVSREQTESAARKQQLAVEKEKEALFAAVPRVADGRPNYEAIPVAARWAGGNNWEIRVKAAFDKTTLFLEYQVTDLSPWVNEGKDWTRLFKTGDAVDIQLGLDASAKPDRDNAVPGDIRLLFAPSADKNVAVLYRYRVKDAAGTNPVEFASPWRSEKVDDVRLLASAKLELQRFDWGYRLRAAVPLKEIGLNDPAGKTLRGDFGIIYGDRQGTVNLSRVYWSNKATGLVNDVPGETMLSPKLWGTLKFGE